MFLIINIVLLLRMLLLLVLVGLILVSRIYLFFSQRDEAIITCSAEGLSPARDVAGAPL